MKESEGGVLTPLVKILQYQEYCVWVLKKDVKDSYLVLYEHDGLCWYHEGLVKKSLSVLLELSLNRVIEVNVASHTLIRVNGEEVKGIEPNQVLDLSDDGERWEGDVLNNQPYGWGVLYDSENRMVYEGFRIGEMNVCYGRSYYPEVGVIEYEGMIFEGKRWGKGVQYDRKGNTVFDGEWMNDDNRMEKQIVLGKENQLLHNHLEELIVSNYRCKGQEWTVLNLSFMPYLRVLEVGDECFEYVEEVKLIGLHKLERVMIGKKCFTTCYYEWPELFMPYGRFYLKNCERLRELKMGYYSFSLYSVCEMENLPSLEVIEMGDYDEESGNFCHASLELKSESERMK